jgi:hypothetical protein
MQVAQCAGDFLLRLLEGVLAAVQLFDPFGVLLVAALLLGEQLVQLGVMGGKTLAVAVVAVDDSLDQALQAGLQRRIGRFAVIAQA